MGCCCSHFHMSKARTCVQQACAQWMELQGDCSGLVGTRGLVTGLRFKHHLFQGFARPSRWPPLLAASCRHIVTPVTVPLFLAPVHVCFLGTTVLVAHVSGSSRVLMCDKAMRELCMGLLGRGWEWYVVKALQDAVEECSLLEIRNVVSRK